jgi:hypothetical protein
MPSILLRYVVEKLDKNFGFVLNGIDMNYCKTV